MFSLTVKDKTLSYKLDGYIVTNFLITIQLYYFGEAVGKPTQSKDLHLLERFQKDPLGFDNRGGGAVIPCKFHIQCQNRLAVTKILKKFFEDYHGTERLDESNSGQQSCPF